MEAAIDKCCDLKTLDDNWTQIIHITDTYAAKQPKQCSRYIAKKIFQPNPNISLKAITLLDACVKNVGSPFVRELSSREFVSTFKSKYSKLHTKPRMKLLELVKQWSVDYESNPEFNLLVTLYAWVQREHPSHISELEASLNHNKRARSRELDRNLKAKEEEDIATAIALSLSDPSNPASSGQKQSNPSTIPHPGIQSASSTSRSQSTNKNSVCVRALFDFEAAEDNEITFKAGDIIILLDDSDPNWWNGKNPAGEEGLFPAQFVSRDLNVGSRGGETVAVNGKDESKKKEENECQGKPVKIDPALVENCLEMLGDADTTGVSRPDPEDLPAMEQKCRAMEPLIEAELEGVYTRISEVDGLKQRLGEVLAQYHDLLTVRAPSQAFPPPNTASGFANPPMQYPYGKPVSVPPGAYPQSMIYQPLPTANSAYQPSVLPTVPPGSIPPMPMYAQPVPGYACPMDASVAWQQQQQQIQPQSQQQQPVANSTGYGESNAVENDAISRNECSEKAPPGNPSVAATYNVG